MPAYNYFKIKKGEYWFIYADNKKRKIDLKAAKALKYLDFDLELIDKEMFYKWVKKAYYESKYARTKDKKYKMKAAHLAKDLEQKGKGFDVNEFVAFIEQAMNYPAGSIDLKKVPVKRLFLEYETAKNRIRHGHN